MRNRADHPGRARVSAVKAREYVTMRAVEDWHWWYAGLRALLEQHWNTYVSLENPVTGDIGCGTGATLALLQSSGRCFGLDRSPHAIALCRERGLAPTAVGSVDAIPFPDAFFDVLLSMDVLPHKWVRDREAAMREMARVMKPGAFLFLNLPAYQWLHSSHDVAVEQEWRPAASTVRRMLTGAGLDSVRVTYWNTLLFPVAAAIRLIRKAYRDESSRSDFRRADSTPLDWLCGAVLRIERAALHYVDLPFGLSIFAVARKPLQP